MKWIFSMGSLVLFLGAGCGPQQDEMVGSQRQAVAVTWTAAAGVTVTGASLTKNAGPNSWSAGAVSNETIVGDGYAEFTTAENNLSKAAGLSNGNTNQGRDDIDFGLLLDSNANVFVIEGGTGRGLVSTYVANDVFRITVTSGQVSYYQNGTLIYTSQGTATSPLLLDTSLFNAGATINNGDITASAFFQNETGVSSSGSSLTKTAGNGWFSGAASSATLTADGYVEFTTAETNTSKIAGLGIGDTDASFGDVDFGVYLLNGGTWGIYENGTARGVTGSYVANDVFRVSVDSDVVTYYQNGSLIYTSAVTPTYPLVFDSSIFHNGATVNNVVVMPAASAAFWQNQLGVTPSGNSLTKAFGGNSWNAGASSVSTLAGDGYVEFTTAENTTSKVAGLSNGDTDRSYGDIDFGFYLRADGQAYVSENGTFAASLGAYANTDTFRIEVIGTTVNYYVNGLLRHTSSNSPTAPLLVDVSLFSTNATINGVTLTDIGSTPFFLNATGVSTTADSLTKTAANGWGNAGASTSTNLTGDGYVEFTTAENTTSKIAGLSNGDTDRSLGDIDFGIYMLSTGGLLIYEGGTPTSFSGTYAASDVFRVDVTSNVVTYYQNGSLIYTSAVSPTAPLRFDSALFTNGATINSIAFTTP